MLLYPMETLDTSSYTMGSNLRNFVGLKVLLETTFNYIKKHNSKANCLYSVPLEELAQDPLLFSRFYVIL